MSALYQRILLWHKLVAMQTGGIALCSAKHKLNRDEAKGWASMLRAVADDIEQFLLDGTFILDDKGQLVVAYVGETISTSCGTPREARHEKVDTAQNPVKPSMATVPSKAGGRRTATRKKQ